MQSKVRWHHHTGRRKLSLVPRSNVAWHARQGAPSSPGGQATLAEGQGQDCICVLNGGSAKELSIEDWASVSTENERNH